MDHVEVLRRMRNEWPLATDEGPALDAALASLSAPQPPAEAQPAAYIHPDSISALTLAPEGGWLRVFTRGKQPPPDGWTPVYTAPPSAPVGVEEHEGAMTSADYIEHCAGVLREHGYRVTASTLADIATAHRALAAQPGGSDNDR